MNDMQFDEKARRKQLDGCPMFRLKTLLLAQAEEDPEIKKREGFIRGAGPMDKQKLVDMLVEKERQMAKGSKGKGKGRKRIEEDEEETSTKAKKKGRKAADDEDEDPDEDEDEKDDEDEDDEEEKPKPKPAKRGRKRAVEEDDEDDEDEKDEDDEDEDEPARKPQRGGGGVDAKLIEQSVELLVELNDKVDKLIKLVTTSGAFIIKAAGGKAKALKAKFSEILDAGADDPEDER